MTAQTRPSTNVRIALPALLAVAFAGSVAVLEAQDGGLALALGALIILGSAIAVSLEPLAGAVMGLAVSAVIVAASRTFGVWTEAAYVPTVVACSASIASASLAALLGARARRAGRRSSGWSGNFPSVGSLGIADATTGEALLGDEILRAQYRGTSLTVLRFAVRARPTGTADTRIQACRAVGRVLDATVHAIDIPFAYADNDMAVILPGGDAHAARRLNARITAALGAGTIRSTGRARLPLADFATVSVGLAQFPLDGETAAALVDAADPANARARARAAARPSDSPELGLVGDASYASHATAAAFSGEASNEGDRRTAVGLARVTLARVEDPIAAPSPS